jgi:hypothetical protein
LSPRMQAPEARKEATKAAVAALEALLTASGLTAAGVKGHIGSELVRDAKKCAKKGTGLPTGRLEELQQGLKALQAEGVVEKIKAAKQQHEQENEQRKEALEATKAAVAALEALPASSGLTAADVNRYIGSELVKNAKTYARQGSGLPAEGLEELQQGLKALHRRAAAEQATGCVTVSMMGGTAIRMELQGGATVALLKHRVEASHGILHYHQQLFELGREDALEGAQPVPRGSSLLLLVEGASSEVRRVLGPGLQSGERRCTQQACGAAMRMASEGEHALCSAWALLIEAMANEELPMRCRGQAAAAADHCISNGAGGTTPSIARRAGTAASSGLMEAMVPFVAPGGHGQEKLAAMTVGQMCSGAWQVAVPRALDAGAAGPVRSLLHSAGRETAAWAANAAANLGLTAEGRRAMGGWRVWSSGCWSWCAGRRTARAPSPSWPSCAWRRMGRRGGASSLPTARRSWRRTSRRGRTRPWR